MKNRPRKSRLTLLWIIVIPPILAWIWVTDFISFEIDPIANYLFAVLSLLAGYFFAFLRRQYILDNNSKRKAIIAFVVGPPGIAAVLFMFLAKVPPLLITSVFGSPGVEIVAVNKSRRGDRRKCSGHTFVKNRIWVSNVLCGQRYEYRWASQNDRLLITGKKSWFGIIPVTIVKYEENNISEKNIDIDYQKWKMRTGL